MRLGFLQKFVNKKNNCFLEAVSGPNRGSILCSVLFNTKPTPSVKHRILALFCPGRRSNKTAASGQPPKSRHRKMWLPRQDVDLKGQLISGRLARAYERSDYSPHQK